MAGLSTNPLDIDGRNFDCEAYLSKVLKEQDLDQLIKFDQKVTQEVRSLDSEMQTLVYENYNKFITATDTIRKMKTDFVKMEEEMDKLTKNMDKITDFSSRVADGLSGRRRDVQRLVKASGTLKQLEFLFKLPSTLQAHIQQKDYTGAVRSYQKAKCFLDRFENVPAFNGISADCSAIIADLKDQLKDSFRGSFTTGKELAANVGYLIQLGESPDDLAQEYLKCAIGQLRIELDALKQTSARTQEIRGTGGNQPIDILEFVDSDCSGFLSNLGLMVTSCNELFPKIRLNLNETVDELFKDFLHCIEERFLADDGNLSDGSLLNRSLDRFYRRIQSINRLLPHSAKEYDKAALHIVFNVARKQVLVVSELIKKRFENSLTEVRQRLATVKNVPRVQQGVGTTLTPAGGDPVGQPLADLLTKLEQAVVHDLKSSLANLLQMTATDLSFVNQQPKFVFRFGFVVRSDLIVEFFKFIADSCHELASGSGESKSAVVATTLLLLLGEFCQRLSSSMIGYILDLCEQQFRIAQLTEKGTPTNFVTGDALNARMKKEAQYLIDQFVVYEGFSISQMLVKSVETRDWLGCLEPKSVRAVMKRVVEDLTAIDWRLSQFLEEGKRIERSSDSSRRTSVAHSKHGFAGGRQPQQQQQWSTAPTGAAGGNYADSAISNTLGKLWTERIDYFTSVEFTKVSVMTGVVKICLKTLLESVRLKTFGKFGLQQVQVDCHYLQTNLWRFVSDENIVQTLLDEVISSVAHRCCAEAKLMDPSVVETICERG